MAFWCSIGSFVIKYVFYNKYFRKNAPVEKPGGVTGGAQRGRAAYAFDAKS
jgi:hypothetical protein